MYISLNKKKLGEKIRQIKVLVIQILNSKQYTMISLHGNPFDKWGRVVQYLEVLVKICKLSHFHPPLTSCCFEDPPMLKVEVFKLFMKRLFVDCNVKAVCFCYQTS